ncbi:MULTISPECIES: hypothetical protein [Vibrio]|uniref:hypothetical protein n=1 Tax=Vibrio TaxID=662 RepID=UPI000375F187|nr:hypothetical protein [Vibrio crassostreae]OEE89865.1 hypothetical protein A140_18320 [Vibrio crassostreae 9ZC88]
MNKVKSITKLRFIKKKLHLLYQQHKLERTLYEQYVIEFSTLTKKAQLGSLSAEDYHTISTYFNAFSNYSNRLKKKKPSKKQRNKRLNAKSPRTNGKPQCSRERSTNSWVSVVGGYR